jgi:hypothetical protein
MRMNSPERQHSHAAPPGRGAEKSVTSAAPTWRKWRPLAQQDMASAAPTWRKWRPLAQQDMTSAAPTWRKWRPLAQHGLIYRCSVDCSRNRE